MRKIFLLAIIIFVIGAAYYIFNMRRVEAPVVREKQVEQKSNSERAAGNNQPENTANSQIPSEFQPPLDRAGERVAKKPFGIFITPQNSPVQPEKFRGYHTGADFEIFPEEAEKDIAVKAICSGALKMKKTASGYGGVLAQSCKRDNEPITVIYGHLKLSSVAKNSGENIIAGETIGILGKGFSAETGGERKHLHLGIYKGSGINILGYVQGKTGLSNWIDPCLYVCK